MFFVFFKQKTAYEMRISDWSSDVCSSDLPIGSSGDRGGYSLLSRSGDGRERSQAYRQRARRRRTVQGDERHRPQDRPPAAGTLQCTVGEWQSDAGNADRRARRAGTATDGAAQGGLKDQRSTPAATCSREKRSEE